MAITEFGLSTANGELQVDELAVDALGPLPIEVGHGFEGADAGVGEATASLDLDLDLDARHNPAWSPTVAATQQTGYSRVQRRAASNSISDATIERLTGLRLA